VARFLFHDWDGSQDIFPINGQRGLPKPMVFFVPAPSVSGVLDAPGFRGSRGRAAMPSEVITPSVKNSVPKMRPALGDAHGTLTVRST
jgi:hypothetical protein